MLARSPHKRTTAAGLPVAVLLAVAVLGASGCSGSTATTSTKSSGTRSTSSVAAAPADAAFIARADAICRRLNDELAASAASKGEGTAAIARNALQHAALERSTTVELSKLEPPPTLARHWPQIIAYRRVLAGDLVVLAHALQRGKSPQSGGLLAAKSAMHASLLVLAKHDGFKDCASVGSAF